MVFSVRPSGITLQVAAETIHVDAWGDGTIRVRAFVDEQPTPLEEGLVVHHPSPADVDVSSDGSTATVTARAGVLSVPVEVTDAVRPGVVSLPHGWGHGQPGTRLRVAAERAGVNSNVLADHEALDPLSGTSVLNGIPVDVVPV